jgi:hypothetical protein
VALPNRLLQQTLEMAWLFSRLSGLWVGRGLRGVSHMVLGDDLVLVLDDDRVLTPGDDRVSVLDDDAR